MQSWETQSWEGITLKKIKLMNNAAKTIENVRNHRDMKLITNEASRNYLVSEPNYHATKLVSENLSGIERKKNTDTD